MAWRANWRHQRRITFRFRGIRELNFTPRLRVFELWQDWGVFAAQIQGKFGANMAELDSLLSPTRPNSL